MWFNPQTLPYLRQLISQQFSINVVNSIENGMNVFKYEEVKTRDELLIPSTIKYRKPSKIKVWVMNIGSTSIFCQWNQLVKILQNTVKSMVPVFCYSGFKYQILKFSA